MAREIPREVTAETAKVKSEHEKATKASKAEREVALAEKQDEAVHDRLTRIIGDNTQRLNRLVTDVIEPPAGSPSASAAVEVEVEVHVPPSGETEIRSGRRCFRTWYPESMDV